MAKNRIDIVSQKKTQAISNLRLMDDALMTLVFDKNIEATELLLNIILERSDLKVLEVVAQRIYKNPMPSGRSITLDIYAQDAEGKIYDVEVQRSDQGANPRRARFHSSMIDTKMLKEKQDFKELHDSYVIFITENDVLGEGLPLYHVDRMIDEASVKFNDGSHIIYVNGSYKNDDALGRLMHDLQCKSAEDMYYTQLAKPVEYFKSAEGGDKMANRALEEYVELCVEEEKFAMAKRLLEKGKMTLEEIAECIQLSPEDVKELANL